MNKRITIANWRDFPGATLVDPIEFLEAELTPDIGDYGKYTYDIIHGFCTHFLNKNPTQKALILPDTHLDADVYIENNWKTSESLEGICLIYCTGDLEISGVLHDDNEDCLPPLIVKGSIKARHWLKSTRPCFVNGDIKLAGLFIGLYCDGPLFSGGALHAAGYFKQPGAMSKEIDGRKMHEFKGGINTPLCDITLYREHNNFPDNLLSQEALEIFAPDDYEITDLIKAFDAGIPIFI